MKMNGKWFLASLVALSGLALFVGAETGENPEAQPNQTPAPKAEETTPAVEALPQANPSADKSPLSYELAQIVKMAESGVDGSIIKAYAERAPLAKPPTAEEIIYLREHNISSEIIMACINRGHEVQEQMAQGNAQKPASVMAPPVYAPIPTGQAPPYVYSAPPVAPGYSYGSTYLEYPAYGVTQPYNWIYPSYYYTPSLWLSYYPYGYRYGHGFFPYRHSAFYGRAGFNQVPARYVAPARYGYGPIGSWGGGTPRFQRSTYGIQGSWGGGTPRFQMNTYGTQGSWGGGTPRFQFNTYGAQGSWGGTTHAGGNFRR